VAALRVGDFDGRSITVARRVRNGRVGATKSAASMRINPLPQWLLPEVADVCAGRDPDVPMWPSLGYSHGNFVARVFKPTVKRLGLPARLRFHDLRHTAVSIALAKGVPPVDVARWVGHSDPGATLRTYAHVLPDRHDSVASVFEAVRPPLRVVG
jgi:integrase